MRVLLMLLLCLIPVSVQAQAVGDRFRAPKKDIEITRIRSDSYCYRYHTSELTPTVEGREECMSKSNFPKNWVSVQALPPTARLDSMHLIAYTRDAVLATRQGNFGTFLPGDIIEVCAVVFSRGIAYPAISNSKVLIVMETNGPLFRFGDATPTGSHCKWLHVTQRTGLQQLERAGLRVARIS